MKRHLIRILPVAAAALVVFAIFDQWEEVLWETEHWVRVVLWRLIDLTPPSGPVISFLLAIVLIAIWILTEDPD